MRKPKDFRPRSFKDPAAALAAITEVYENQTQYLQTAFEAFATGKADLPDARLHGYYPYLKVTTTNANRIDSRVSYGFVPRPGVYATTLTRPDVLGDYYLRQIDLLIANHGHPVEVGISDTPIPIHFAAREDMHLESHLDVAQVEALAAAFDHPDLSIMDDEIANGTYAQAPDMPGPLSLFTAPRVDLSILRLRHYTATSAKHFQNFVIFTNYQFYIDEFIRICHDIMAASENPVLRKERLQYDSFVEPGNKITVNRNGDGSMKDDAGTPLRRMPQMPAYHLRRADGNGITMINIGVGPSNAKTITDHVAVLRPHAWLMLGHCAGLRNSQALGDYVLAHGYLREDNVLYHDIHPSIPIPPLSEIQLALEKAVADVTGLKGFDLKKIMRTGTVATVDDRNWELRPYIRQNRRLSQSRAIALDMESGTIAANGFRFRVPYGTLLCVSDKPLHGQLKLPGMAESFYRQRVDQHLQIGLLAMTMLREQGVEKLHSRKLRSFNEVAFQ